MNITSQLFHMDLSNYDLDGQIPSLTASTSHVNGYEIVESFRRQGMTLRQFVVRMAANRLHRNLIGAAEEVADDLEMWFREGAADGFNLLPPMVPGSLDDFIALVLPILLSRGLFRSEYEETTLRARFANNNGSPNRVLHNEQVTT